MIESNSNMNKKISNLLLALIGMYGTCKTVAREKTKCWSKSTRKREIDELMDVRICLRTEKLWEVQAYI